MPMIKYYININSDLLLIVYSFYFTDIISVSDISVARVLKYFSYLTIIFIFHSKTTCFSWSDCFSPDIICHIICKGK